MTQLPHRPRLKESIDVFADPAGNVHLYRGADNDFVIEPGGREAVEFLRSLDGGRGVEEIARDQGTDIDAAAALRQLTELALIEDAADDEVLTSGERERYDRQLRYFGDCAPPHVSRAQFQLRLRGASVAVLGLGGLGGSTALALASTGVGRLVLVDGDVVELSNLNRQVLYRDQDVGRAKAEVAAARLREVNPEGAYETMVGQLCCPGDVEQAVAGADLVVDAVDTPVHLIEHWVNEACFKLDVPYIAMSQFPPRVRIGPLFVPGHTGCYLCQEAAWRRRYPLFDALAAHRSRRPSPAASFGPSSLLVGAQVANDVVHYLAGLGEPRSLGCSVVMNLMTMEVEFDAVARDPDCRVCSCSQARPTRHGLRTATETPIRRHATTTL